MMSYIKKSEQEKNLLNHIKKVGLSEFCSMYGEGRNKNRIYYRFTLSDGAELFWTNPSDDFLKELGIEE